MERYGCDLGLDPASCVTATAQAFLFLTSVHGQSSLEILDSDAVSLSELLARRAVVLTFLGFAAAALPDCLPLLVCFIFARGSLGAEAVALFRVLASLAFPGSAYMLKRPVRACSVAATVHLLTGGRLGGTFRCLGATFLRWLQCLRAFGLFSTNRLLFVFRVCGTLPFQLALCSRLVFVLLGIA